MGRGRQPCPTVGWPRSRFRWDSLIILRASLRERSGYGFRFGSQQQSTDFIGAPLWSLWRLLMGRQNASSMRSVPRQHYRAPIERGASILPALARIELPILPTRPCPYRPGESMRVRAFLAESMLPSDYQALMDQGFRRTGTMLYAPACETCSACIPLRVPVDEFTPSKSQRRVLRRNADVQVTVRRPEADDATYALYRRYLEHQHPGSELDSTRDSYRESYVATCVDTHQIDFSLNGTLIGFSIVDVCATSLSAVYHAFDPDFARRSLGVYSALTEITLAQQMGIPYYYLGYWIAQSPAMAYKADYRPHEIMVYGK
nr:arginyltransferase [Phycisphaerae bacterium]